MKTMSVTNSMRMAAMAAALLVAGMAPFFAHAQSSDSHDVIELVTGEGKVVLRASAHDSCTATSSGRALAIAIAGQCWSFGTSGDIPRPLYVKITADKLILRDEGKSYVIRDASAIASARGLFEPFRDAMGKQAALNREVNKRGIRQSGTSPSFGEARVSVPDLSAEFRKVEAEAKRLSAEGGTQSELSELQSELSELQARVSERQSEASEEKSELSEQVGAMSSQVEAMNEEMQAWTGEGEKAAEQAARQIKELLDQAIASGIAKPE